MVLFRNLNIYVYKKSEKQSKMEQHDVYDQYHFVQMDGLILFDGHIGFISYQFI